MVATGWSYPQLAATPEPVLRFYIAVRNKQAEVASVMRRNPGEPTH